MTENFRVLQRSACSIVLFVAIVCLVSRLNMSALCRYAGIELDERTGRPQHSWECRMCEAVATRKEKRLAAAAGVK